MRKHILYLLAILLLASFASAFTFDYSPSSVTIDNTSQMAVFYMTVGNDNERMNETLRFSGVDVDWAIQSDPLEDYLGGATLMPGEKKQINLFFKPSEVMTLGPKKVELTVKSELTGKTESKYFFINIGSSEPPLREYLAAVGKILDMPARIDPREPVSIRMNLENKNPKNITEMLIKLDSKLIKKEEITSLAPLGSRNVLITASLDPYTPPQKDVMRVSLMVDGRTLQPLLEEKFEVTGYSEIIEREIPKKTAFLKATEGKTYYNEGNIKAEKQILAETNFFNRIFTGTEPEAYVIYRNGKQYLTWDISLEPRETRQIAITKDYRILFFMILLAVLSVLFYYVFRSPVVMKKEAVVIGIKEGGISELRVLIHIKNRTGTAFENFAVTDRVPHIADLDEDIETGTLKPTKSVRHKEGLMIKWELPALEKYEERILSYKIKSKLTILGGFMLPKATAKFAEKGKKEKTEKSNPVRVEV